ncbi:hypothetical protein, partial [Klebsiella michiganensis]
LFSLTASNSETEQAESSIHAALVANMENKHPSTRISEITDRSREMLQELVCFVEQVKSTHMLCRVQTAEKKHAQRVLCALCSQSRACSA